MHWSPETMNALAVAGGVGIPVVLWAARMYWITKKTLNMHLDPDKYGFGTGKTNILISQMMVHQEKSTDRIVDSSDSLRDSIRELSHYVKWDTKQRTGDMPPPYTRHGD